ncbi:MAG TPA: metal-sulfur cluster assembly factor [Stellaceae bacterium]|nr:metal-sulfur cluster assembly factor [Stellaceae bacterium]
MSPPTVEAVEAALREVIDPELGYNIVDLGLIYDVAIDERGAVAIVMTTTSPGCPATAALEEGARACAALVPGAAGVDVQMVWQPRWTPARMSAEAKQHFGVES